MTPGVSPLAPRERPSDEANSSNSPAKSAERLAVWKPITTTTGSRWRFGGCAASATARGTRRTRCPMASLRRRLRHAAGRSLMSAGRAMRSLRSRTTFAPCASPSVSLKWNWQAASGAAVRWSRSGSLAASAQSRRCLPPRGRSASMSAWFCPLSRRIILPPHRMSRRCPCEGPARAGHLQGPPHCGAGDVAAAPTGASDIRCAQSVAEGPAAGPRVVHARPPRPRRDLFAVRDAASPTFFRAQ